MYLEAWVSKYPWWITAVYYVNNTHCCQSEPVGDDMDFKAGDGVPIKLDVLFWVALLGLNIFKQWMHHNSDIHCRYQKTFGSVRNTMMNRLNLAHVWDSFINSIVITQHLPKMLMTVDVFHANYCNSAIIKLHLICTSHRINYVIKQWETWFCFHGASL